MSDQNLWFGRCLLVGGALILAGLIIEYILVPKVLVRPITITSSGGEYVLSDNIDLLYVPVPNRGEFNNAGHRGKDYSLEKQPSVNRVLFFGDSVTDGFAGGIRFSRLLQQHYATIEIINLAVQGYNLVQEFEYLKTKGINYEPDEVLFFLTYNDLELHSGEVNDFWETKRRHEASAWYRYLYDGKEATRNWLLYFNTYRYFLSMWHVDRRNQPHYLLDDDATENLIDEMVLYCQERDIELGFVILPFLGPSNDIVTLRRVLNDAGLSVTDLDTELRQTVSPEELQSLFLPNDNCHFNEKGHRTVTDLLLSKGVLAEE